MGGGESLHASLRGTKQEPPLNLPQRERLQKKSFKALSFGEGLGEAIASFLAMTRGGKNAAIGGERGRVSHIIRDTCNVSLQGNKM